MNVALQDQVEGKKEGLSQVIMRWLNDNTEQYLIIGLYAALALVVVGDVASRVVTGNQSQWGSSVSIYCFIWLSWIGCAYHVKQRTHLRFGSFRQKLPRIFQAAWYIFDDLLWIALGGVVVVGVYSLISMQLMLNNQIQGTSLPLALATISIPIGWALVVFRAIQDVIRVISGYRRGADFETEIGLGG